MYIGTCMYNVNVNVYVCVHVCMMYICVSVHYLYICVCVMTISYFMLNLGTMTITVDELVSFSSELVKDIISVKALMISSSSFNFIFSFSKHYFYFSLLMVHLEFYSWANIF